MNTFTESTELPLMIYFKTDLTGDTARKANAWTLTLSELDSVRNLGWARLLEISIEKALREKGILPKFPACAQNNFSTDAVRKPFVIGRKGQTVGLFESADWRAGIATIREVLELWHILEFSEIGWRDPHEIILRIIYPNEIQTSFDPVILMLRKWADELQAEWSPQNPPAP